VDARSDIYSLGAVAYFMLTGRPPFDDERPLRVLFKHVSEPPVPPTQIIDSIPADLEGIVLRCLAKKPEERFNDTLELSAALQQCSDASAWTAASALHWWREQSPADAPGEPAEADLELRDAIEV
jgi:serine/threonine-protein kinase